MQAEGIFLDSLWWMHYSSKYSNLPHFYPKIHLSDAFKPILTSEILCYKPPVPGGLGGCMCGNVQVFISVCGFWIAQVEFPWLDFLVKPAYV